jgi:hypothetical protein
MGSQARALRFEEKARRCAECHDSPHGDQFARRKDQGACESCHGLDAFVPATAFDHERDATFVLEGAHARVACAACHARERGEGNTTRIVYYPVSHRCESCHVTAVPPLVSTTSRETRP